MGRIRERAVANVEQIGDELQAGCLTAPSKWSALTCGCSALISPPTGGAICPNPAMEVKKSECGEAEARRRRGRDRRPPARPRASGRRRRWSVEETCVPTKKGRRVAERVRVGGGRSRGDRGCRGIVLSERAARAALRARQQDRRIEPISRPCGGKAAREEVRATSGTDQLSREKSGSSGAGTERVADQPAQILLTLAQHHDRSTADVSQRSERRRSRPGPHAYVSR